MLRPSRVLLALIAGLAAVQCNVSHCEDLRDELFAVKLKWQGCQRDVDCIIVGGNSKDCTGILTCNVAVNRTFRDEADRRIASLPEETADCVACQASNCVAGDIPLCEPVTKQCIIVSRVLDGGVGALSTVTPDSGLTLDAGTPDADASDAAAD